MNPLYTTLALVLAGVGAACRSGSGPSVEDAVRSYSAAFLSGKGEKAARMLSARCDTPERRDQVIRASKLARTLYGQARIVSVKAKVDGDLAAVTYRFDQPAIDQEDQRWVYESGAWH